VLAELALPVSDAKRRVLADPEQLDRLATPWVDTSVGACPGLAMVLSRTADATVITGLNAAESRRWYRSNSQRFNRLACSSPPRAGANSSRSTCSRWFAGSRGRRACQPTLLGRSACVTRRRQLPSTLACCCTMSRQRSGSPIPAGPCRYAPQQLSDPVGSGEVGPSRLAAPHDDLGSVLLEAVGQQPRGAWCSFKLRAQFEGTPDRQQRVERPPEAQIIEQILQDNAMALQVFDLQGNTASATL
jgi:hypothetical protein